MNQIGELEHKRIIVIFSQMGYISVVLFDVIIL